MLAMRGDNALSIDDIDERFGVTLNLHMNRVDQVQGTFGVILFIGSDRVNPDRKELGAQVSFAGLIQVNVTLIAGVATRNIEVLVQKPLRRVGVSIDHNRRSLNALRFG